MANARRKILAASASVSLLKRPLAVLIAFTPAGGSAFAAEETIVVDASASAPQESAWGPAPTIAAKRSATGTKTDTPIEKIRSRFRW